MPELPEVETIARGLAPELVGRTVSDVVVHHAPATGESADSFVCKVKGGTFTRIWRRGKLLLLDLVDAQGGLLHLAVHLRMTGRFWLPPAGMVQDKHTHLVLTLDNSRRIFFHDVRKFGSCQALSSAELAELPFYRTLGPEPLEISISDFIELFKSRNAGMKSLLLNQKILAGIGNIYADESLFRARINPKAKGADVSRRKLGALHAALQEVLQLAIRENGSSISDYRNAHGDAGAFQNSFQVYGRKGLNCLNCGKQLPSGTVAGRTTVWCKHCQR